MGLIGTKHKTIFRATITALIPYQSKHSFPIADSLFFTREDAKESLCKAIAHLTAEWCEKYDGHHAETDFSDGFSGKVFGHQNEVYLALTGNISPMPTYGTPVETEDWVKSYLLD